MFSNDQHYQGDDLKTTTGPQRHGRFAKHGRENGPSKEDSDGFPPVGGVWRPQSLGAEGFTGTPGGRGG